MLTKICDDGKNIEKIKQYEFNVLSLPNTIWCDLGYSQLWTVQMLDGVTNSVSVQHTWTHSV